MSSVRAQLQAVHQQCQIQLPCADVYCFGAAMRVFVDLAVSCSRRPPGTFAIDATTGQKRSRPALLQSSSSRTTPPSLATVARVLHLKNTSTFFQLHILPRGQLRGPDVHACGETSISSMISGAAFDSTAPVSGQQSPVCAETTSAFNHRPDCRLIRLSIISIPCVQN